MGKGIIFIGGENLNRNRAQQSMYNYGYHNKYNQQKDDNRLQFYKELCLQGRSLPLKKGRDKKIRQLSSKYQGSACSEKTMEKVFISYSECFHIKMKSNEKKKKLLDLPKILEENKVDKRVIKRIKEIEGIEEPFKDNMNKKLNVIPESKSIKKRKFYEMLNEYLIKSHFNNQIVMSQELKEMCELYNRRPIYINYLKIIYIDMIDESLTFSQAYEKTDYPIYKSDRHGLSTNWNLYKNHTKISLLKR